VNIVAYTRNCINVHVREMNVLTEIPCFMTCRPNIIIRPHFSTTYVDAADCYRMSSVVCEKFHQVDTKTLLITSVVCRYIGLSVGLSH